MKKTVGYIFKCIIAGIISVVLLSLFSLVYYNPPIASEQPDCITNYKFIPNSKWSYMLEGFGFGETDNLGYNNAYYDDCFEPDIVFMGSSHIEATQVPQDSNCVYLLNEMFDKDDLTYNNFKCLNLGISAHFFEVSASNYKYVASKFKGTKYIVIEVFNVEFSPSMLDEIIEGKFHSPLEKRGFIHKTAQRIPFFRLLYKKINDLGPVNYTDNDIENEENPALNSDIDINVYINKMNTILDKISKTSEENGIEPIILMHGQFWEDPDGNIITQMNETYKNAFKKCCETNGIKVIDVVPAMIDNYKKNFEFSYGFSNSAPGEGHLNKTGHRIIAETLYEKTNEMEENK